MAFRVSVRLARDTFCLSDTVEGSVAVDVEGTSHDVAAAAPSAVRVALRAVEEAGKRHAIEHMALVTTVAGPSTAHEEAAAAALRESVNRFTTEAARRHPLLGVPVSTDSTMLVEGAASEHYTYSAGAGAASNPGGVTSETATSPPQRWEAGGHYVYPFALQLPPWLPPSYYYKPSAVKSHMSMRYTVAAFVVCGVEEADVDVVPREFRLQMTVLVPCTPLPAKAWRGSSCTSDGGAEGADKRGTCASAPLLSPVRFLLPAEIPQLLERLPAAQLVDFTVLSALPKRELQQCVERVSISPPFREKLTYHIYKYSLVLRGLLRNKPYTAVDVCITYDSGAAVLLCGRQQSVVRGGVALGLAAPHGNDSGDAPAALSSAGSGVAPGGLTVMGTVVGGEYSRAPRIHTDNHGMAPSPLGKRARGRQSPAAADPHTGDSANSLWRDGEGAGGSQLSALSACTEPAINGALRLHVRVRTGSVAVSKVRVKLLERVRCTSAPATQPNDVYTLATYTHSEKIHANTSTEFPIELALPKQFRHIAADNEKYPPPAGITTAAVHTTTWLQITFPSLHAVSEAQLAENVVLVGEDVDLTDTVPFLPCACPVRTL
ncbi:hypothetical protein LMJF_35_0450 [Leishmania major strain Friedlin]|uniref:Arrestin-like N-terminal domain-containing protein n=1 Tax=Leishmania major TaxID=5664 RepID=E9AEM2_LEIMA|nr:hypothetical protein LMJF_35_0450 [Leishmania major strain Friedlin]CAG9582399.1 Arrestin_(or_S-antigen)_-_N-terminal_domain_containing_protein_-_putative [Leishmania major strain Friedlin]CBZ12675.1 hypothetical protein LMJF_35_0450 [Leishmania major strain Friedlin]|eukprot:XP_003722442.1 hypothetical protein LMJF_35_0450 [Leishmania major strain Friedlin]